MTGEQLVDAVMAGDVTAVAESRRRGLVPEVAAAVSRRLSPRAGSPNGGITGWWTAQHAVMALATAPEASGLDLATSLLGAVVTQGWREEVLDLEVCAWLSDRCPTAVAGHLGRGVRGDLDNLAEAVFMLPGDLGAEWFVVLVRSGWGLPTILDMHDRAAASGTRDAVARWPRRWIWSGDDWCRKLHALADARLPVPPRVLFGLSAWSAPALPPVASCSAQIRIGLVYGEGDLSGLLDVCAEHLAAYRTGDPARDVDLVWWECTSEPELSRLREVLQLAGPPDWRSALLTAAVRHGRIGEDAAAFLTDEGEAPASAHAATVERLENVATIEVGGDGRVWFGDLYSRDGATGASIPVAGPTVAIRAVVGSHPRNPRATTQAIELVGAADPVTRWEPVRFGDKDHMRCRGPRLSIGPAGILGIFRGYPMGAELFRDLIQHMPAPSITDTPAGPVISEEFSAPHRPVRAWLGYRVDDRVVRVVIDLGLDLDPRAAPLPWAAGSQHEAALA